MQTRASQALGSGTPPEKNKHTLAFRLWTCGYMNNQPTLRTSPIGLQISKQRNRADCLLRSSSMSDSTVSPSKEGSSFLHPEMMRRAWYDYSYHPTGQIYNKIDLFHAAKGLACRRKRTSNGVMKAMNSSNVNIPASQRNFARH